MLNSNFVTQQLVYKQILGLQIDIKQQETAQAMILNNQIKLIKQPITNYTSATCQIKSRFLGSWDQRLLVTAFEQNLLYVHNNSDKKKSYELDKVKVIGDESSSMIFLQMPNGRKYQVKVNKQVLGTLNSIQYFKLSQKLVTTVKELPTPHPKKINYYATVRSLSFNQDYKPQHRSSIIIPVAIQTIQTQNKQQAIRKSVTFQRRKSFIIDQDWQRDTKNGGLNFINTQKKSIISKMISYIIKRVISTGSFMGISFPTFAMKPQTILQTYCKCLGAAPLLLDTLSNDPVQRMKAFNALILTISIQFNDIEKPFNPVIGQTFQGQIRGYQVYAEQTSHHPPIASFFLDGSNYVLHGSLELNANLGLNSAVGIFYGEVVIQFDDGSVIRGLMPSGRLTGIVFGETKFCPYGAVFSYDRINHIVSSYEVKQKDIMMGFIGKLKAKNYSKFLGLIDSKGKERYQKFKGFKQNQFQKIYAKMQTSWTSYIKYDDKMYFDYHKAQNLPIKLTQNISPSGQTLLKSDSSFRKDIKLRAQIKIEQAQNQKQTIQQQQRRLRKLRQAGKDNTNRYSFH